MKQNLISKSKFYLITKILFIFKNRDDNLISYNFINDILKNFDFVKVNDRIVKHK